MAYFNNTDSPSFYPISEVPGEVNFYPFLAQASATEEVGVVGDYTDTTFPGWWSTIGQPGPAVYSPTTLLATTSNCEPVATATSYATRYNGYCQPPYPGNYWPAVGQQAQYLRPSHSSSDSPLVSASVYQPEAVPTNYWGVNQSEPSASTYYAGNIHTFHQPSTGPARTALMPMGRFQPYRTSSAYLNELGNAEAGSSILAPLSILPIPQPSGGRSETTADAENDYTTTEEHRATKPKQTRLPRGQGKVRRSRVRTRGDGHKLCEWVQRREKLQEAPSFNTALAAAVEIIPRIRPRVYSEPRLQKGRGMRTATGSKSANDEFERRNVERALYRELSQYYSLGQNPKLWTRPPLLLRVLKDLEGLPALPEPSNGSQP